MTTITRPGSTDAANESTPIRTTAFLVGVPLAWGILLLFHPTGEGDEFYPVLQDQVTPWLVVHIGTMIFLPLMGARRPPATARARGYRGDR